MAGSASDYHRGEMNIAEQTSTFHLVMGMTKWGSLVIAAGVLTLVLWFCTHAGFFTAVLVGLIVLILGIVVLREKKSAGH